MIEWQEKKKMEKEGYSISWFFQDPREEYLKRVIQI